MLQVAVCKCVLQAVTEEVVSMSDLKMGTSEAGFADTIWEREPVTSDQLAKIGAEELNWKKSTSHTVLRRLCEQGLFKVVYRC